MNIDLGSFAFGNTLQTPGGTPSWGTALGQSQPDYKLTYPGAEAIAVSLVYNSVPLSAVSLPLGKGGKIYKANETDECQIAALYRKVYINGIRVDYPFIIIQIKEQSNSHNGRRSIKYSEKNEYSYQGEFYSNAEFIRQARKSLGIGEDACWFVYALEIKNQDELHMLAVIVNDRNNCFYENSSERKKIWLELIPEINDSQNIITSTNSSSYDASKAPRQQIFYGAPGTGKSNEIKEKTTGQDVIRTTFHPDSDYSTFVGAYKPVMEESEQHVVPVVIENGISLDQNNGTYKEKRITYKFVMQAFLKAYLGAWKKYADNPKDPKPQYLVIEEINRGNCAQIFGDLFQLLDRNEKDFSTYPIYADTDLRQVVKDAFENDEDYQLTTDLAVDNVIDGYTSNYGATLSKDIQEGRVLVLPKNLYIWATMNTSDQSLFPIDSAFKRRWDWKYIKICDHKEENYKILIDDEDEKPDWWEFLKKINEIIASMTSSADKQLGYFFCKADNNKTISKEKFVSKVIFYLWNDVFKDYGFEDSSLFRYKDSDGVERDLTFPDFYNEDGKEVNTTRLKDFLEKVKNWKSKTEENK